MAIVMGVIGLLFAATFFIFTGLGIFWLYRRFILKKTDDFSPNSITQVVFPRHFAWALFLALVGFHLALYPFFSFTGPNPRIPGIGSLIFGILMAVGWVLISRRSLFVYSVIALQFLLGVSLFARANGFVQSWSGILFLVTQIILAISLIKEQLPTSVAAWFRQVILFIPLAIYQLIRVGQSIIKRESDTHSSFYGWIKTALISFVVLVIFLGLLSQADPVFAEIVREFRSQLVGRTIWSILFILLALSLWTARRTADKDEETKAGWLSIRDSSVVLAITAVVIAAFLTIQYQYLFAGSTELLKRLDLTFSEYVRQGFTELLLAVAFGGLISFLAGAKARQWQGVHRLGTRLLTSVVIVELALLLLSALQRNLLYVQTYGLTRVRVAGDFFLGWLGVLLVLLVLFTWHKLREKTALAVLWSAALVVILLVNVVNIDSLVVKGAPSHHQYTDYFYLMQLSEDAASHWPTLLTQMQEDSKSLLAKETLTDEEKAQLAGIKLALVTFIEKRDRLYLLYAPESWVLERLPDLGINLPADESYRTNMSFWYNRTNVIQTLFPKPSVLAQRQAQPDLLPNSLIKYRAWQYRNQAEVRAFATLQALEPTTFDLPRQLLDHILQYQILRQIDLAEAENRLLYELKYQFITVNLQRYWPQHLVAVETDDLADQPSFVTAGLAKLNLEQRPVLTLLANQTCDTILAPTQNLVVRISSQVQSGTATPSGTLYRAMSLLADSPESFQFILPPTIKILDTESFDQPEKFAAETLRPVTSPTAASVMKPTIVKLSLSAVPVSSDEAGCRVQYTATAARLIGIPQ